MLMNWVKAHKIRMVLIGAFAVLTIISFLLAVKMTATLEYTSAAKRWQGEGKDKFAYISVFLPENEALTEQGIYSLKQTVNTKLTEASLEAEEGKNLWNYAYSVTSYVNVSTERGSSSVNALGIGGEFFFFHPMHIASGSYISESDLMHDRVVLTKELAWKLFGATDVAGMALTVNGREFLVAGVVESENDFATQAATTEDSGLFMHYDILSDLTDAEIECFEAVLPNPVKGFAMGLIGEAITSENAVKIEVSDRYTLKNAFDIVAGFGKRSMRNDGIVYATWENATRLTEDYFALFVMLTIFFASPLLCLAFYELVKYAKIGAGKGKSFIEKKAENICERVNDSLYERERRAKINDNEKGDE